jgi:hypothetical protein
VPEDEDVDDSYSTFPIAHSEGEEFDGGMRKGSRISEELEENAGSSSSARLQPEGSLNVVPLRLAPLATTTKKWCLGAEWNLAASISS